MHLALLDASLGTPHAKRNFRREVDASLTVYDVNDGELPPALDEAVSVERVDGPASSFDGAIISGSQSSVYDDHRPWIPDLRRWVEGALADGLPILGVCWGHQLLAQILGGTVRGGSYELGYITVNQDADDPLWNGLPDPFMAFATHSDHVVEMPPDAQLLASNETGVQAFRQDRAYAVQFHPEYDLHTAKAMIRSKELSERAIQEALATCNEASVEASKSTAQIFDNFLAHVAASANQAPSSALNA